jgi:phosphoesterase RecJ-like protein
METELKQFIDEAKSVLITSHIGPDGDSVASTVLLYKLIKQNHPDMQVFVSMEEPAPYLDFIDGYQDIWFKPLSEAVKLSKPDLLIILDANSLKRVTRSLEEVTQLIDGVKVAIIDHHEQAGKDDSDLYINLNNPAVSQDIYELFIERLGYKKPEGYAQTAMVGIYTDTGGFIYKNPNYKKTFEVAAQLIEDGANLEIIVNKLNTYSDDSLKVLQELFKNTSSDGNCTYTFLSDEFIEGLSNELVREATDIFRSHFLRNIEGRPWGFTLYRDPLDHSIYSASFRALADTVDVSKVAGLLGGGGHKPAAGAKVKAESVSEALKTVLAAIEQSRNS